MEHRNSIQSLLAVEFGGRGVLGAGGQQTTRLSSGHLVGCLMAIVRRNKVGGNTCMQYEMLKFIS